VSQAQAAHEPIAGSQLVIFDGAGHFPHAKDPERFVTTIRNLVDSTSGLELEQAEWRSILTAGPSLAV